MTTVGLLRPEGHPEDDYRRIETLLDGDIRVDPVVYGGPGADPGVLAAGAERLRLAGTDAVVWASAGESFAQGWEAARERARSLALAAGIPASSTAIGFAHAVRAVDAARVVVAGARAGELAGAARFLGEAGIEVVGEWRADGRLPLAELVRAADDPRADAVLVPDTAVPTAAEVPEAEAAVGKPVLTGTLVTVWEGLRLAERHGAWADELGALFVRRSPRDVWEPGE
ncbi:decarboxylase [Streptomyces somaliensis]|uniref:aspartate racemase/maleate isomerase family protein n=1 Tax=Streptomyces somaliensis TaxID=78355 RepID=UPI0020CE3860|nr:decarboxylase [Streptomyces somaliensis]MCP9945724.1 decarboxylase [Streptomyces somaliensis]MCP9961099.1 decarboxylase [Streptomyces somaliensis]MCP9973893.1 decarboxylase [Streptomyces somaliensis]